MTEGTNPDVALRVGLNGDGAYNPPAAVARRETWQYCHRVALQAEASSVLGGVGEHVPNQQDFDPTLRAARCRSSRRGMSAGSEVTPSSSFRNEVTSPLRHRQPANERQRFQLREPTKSFISQQPPTTTCRVGPRLMKPGRK